MRVPEGTEGKGGESQQGEVGPGEERLKVRIPGEKKDPEVGR